MVSNSGFHWFHCSKQEVESFLLVFKAKQNLIQDLYTLEILPLIQKFEKKRFGERPYDQVWYHADKYLGWFTRRKKKGFLFSSLLVPTSPTGS